MSEQKKLHHQVWIRNEVWDKVESLRIRDETTSSIINFLYEFYIDNRPEKEDIIYQEKK